MAEPIRITGLREFQSSLRQMDAGLPKQIRIILNQAVELVTDYAVHRFPSRTGRAKGSIKARSSQREARAALGGRRAPYAPGLDFGGGRPQFPAYRRGGRYLYRGLDVHRDDITRKMSEGLAALARGAGVEVE